VEDLDKRRAGLSGAISFSFQTRRGGKGSEGQGKGERGSTWEVTSNGPNLRGGGIFYSSHLLLLSSSSRSLLGLQDFFRVVVLRVIGMMGDADGVLVSLYHSSRKMIQGFGEFARASKFY
jgi:hypothetical protein